MCNGPLNGLVDSFSAFQLLRNYNRLVTPPDFSQYYNIAFIKDFERRNAPFAALKPVDLILTNSHANPPQTTQNLYQNGASSIKHSIPNNRSSPSRTTVSSTCPPTPPATVVNHTLNDSFNSLSDNVSNCDRLLDDGALADGNGVANNAIALNTSVASVGGNSNGAASQSSSIDHYQCILNRRQRGEKRPIPDEQKDEKYFERRKRNNEAAKKSRDARKLREDRIAFRAAILEQENAILRAQVLALREEVASLQQMMCNRASI